MHISQQYPGPNFFHHINATDYPNFETYFVDNSQDPEYHKKIKALGYACDHVSPAGKSSREYIAESQNKIRQHFLASDCDAWFSQECDVFTQPGTLQQLLVHNQPAVSALYFIGNHKNAKLMVQIIERLKKDKKCRFLTEREQIAYCTGPRLKQAYSAGLGALLLHRHVVEKIKFRHVAGEPSYSDSYFAEDCSKAGIPIHIDTQLFAKHYNQNWDFVENL